MIGTHLADRFKAGGHRLVRIIRKKTKYEGGDPCLVMDTAAGSIEKDKLEGLDAVIHLAGAGIAEHKWTPQYKRTIYESRVETTKLLASALAALEKKPGVFLSGSAIGYYGSHQPDDPVDERTPLGGDYLAQVCQHWESAAQEAQEAGIRTVFMRTGIVLSRRGGALAKMLPVLRSGLGGRLGSGRQMMSWIALEEFPSVIEHIMADPKISGPVNFVSPQPVSNEEFTKSLAAILKRPAFLPAPAFAIKALLGEMGDVLLLKGARILPRVLSDSGYRFRFPEVSSALKKSLSE